MPMIVTGVLSRRPEGARREAISGLASSMGVSVGYSFRVVLRADSAQIAERERASQ